MSDYDFECANCEEVFRAKERRDWHPPESRDPNETMHLCPECHGYARGYAEARAAEPLPAPEGPRCPECTGPLVWLCVVCGQSNEGGPPPFEDDEPDAPGRTEEQAVVEAARRVAGENLDAWGGCGMCGKRLDLCACPMSALRAALARSTPRPHE